MPENSIELVLTDVPYGIGEANGKNISRSTVRASATNFGHSDWDNQRITKEYFDEMRRVSLTQIIFGGIYYTDFLPPSSCWIVWDKCNQNSDFADCELAWTSFDTATRLFRWTWDGFRQHDMGKKEKRIHPTQKPRALFTWLLQNYSFLESDIILDPFLGSGTTAEACKLLHRNFIGIEINSDYCKIAEERLAQGVL